MIEKQSCIHVYSELNEWIDLCILVSDDNYDEAINIVQSSYNDWFENDSCDAILDYILNSLTENDIEYKAYFNVENISQ